MTNFQKRGGHYPGHVRDLFNDAIEAYRDWKNGDPEPTVTAEIHYKPHEIPISQVCGLLWHCTDQLPGDAVSSLKGSRH